MMRGLWTRGTVAMMLIAGDLPLMAFWLWYGGAGALGRLALAVLVVAIWHLVFMLVRAQPPSLSGLVTALAVAMLAPEDLGVFRLALGISFGVVMGELVFGGWGRNVVNPATVALSFLGFGFPAFGWPGFDAPVAWAAIPAVLIGVGSGVMPGAALAGAILIGAIASAAGLLPEPVLYAGAIVLVLLVLDPVTSAATMLGRWVYGMLFAIFTVFFAQTWAGAAPAQVAVSAALLVTLAAPLIDEIALALWLAARRRHHGRT